MMTFPIEELKKIQTPYYYYDLKQLHAVLGKIKSESEKYGYIVHYALKANANDRLLQIIRSYSLGADCVSGNEILISLKNGFLSEKIAFAGVGKTDEEINIGLENNIFCFNSESVQEIEVINSLAGKKNKIAPIALRINPNVNAKTHHYITTGLEENKFGIGIWELENVIKVFDKLKNIKLTGLHFHIGSQITDLDVFKELCTRVNEIQEWFYNHRIIVDHINVGGGLGIDYENPDNTLIPDFQEFFALFNKFIELRPKQRLHFELGRAVVANSGSLITKVLYVKRGIKTNFLIVDAGMTELIRPALYQSYHKIENIIKKGEVEKYDVVGPICESSDCFGKAVSLPETERGDLIAIRSTGAYGEAMASRYNMRDLVKAYYSSDILV